MSGRSRSRAAKFLDDHVALRAARDRSSVWPRIKADSVLDVRGKELYIVGGDTLGDEDELYLDRIARGAWASSPDELSRELFLELPEELRGIVWSELLRQPETGNRKKTNEEDRKWFRT